MHHQKETPHFAYTLFTYSDNLFYAYESEEKLGGGVRERSCTPTPTRTRHGADGRRPDVTPARDLHYPYAFYTNIVLYKLNFVIHEIVCMHINNYATTCSLHTFRRSAL